MNNHLKLIVWLRHSKSSLYMSKIPDSAASWLLCSLSYNIL